MDIRLQTLLVASIVFNVVSVPTIISKTFQPLAKQDHSDGWTVIGGSASFKLCTGPTYRGFNNFIVRDGAVKHFTLPSHETIFMRVQYWKVDAWNEQEFQIWIDDHLMFKQKFYYEPATAVCPGVGEGGWLEKSVIVEVSAAHTAPTAIIVFTSTLQEGTNERWGIKDIEIQTDLCPGGASWIILSSKYGKQVSICNEVCIIGGFDVLGVGGETSKEFALPPHNRIRISGTLYLIDSWDNEWMNIQVDGINVFQLQWHCDIDSVVNICGLGYKDGIKQFDQIVIHSAALATVRFYSGINEDAYTQSWGFKDFQIFYEATVTECATLFTEFDYEGEFSYLCAKSANFEIQSIIPEIKSIKIPPLSRIILYENSNYSGQSREFTSNNPRINENQATLVQQSGIVEGQWIEYKYDNQL